MYRTVRNLSVATALFAFSFSVALAAPQAELWPRWEAHDPASTEVLDHAPWGRFLETNLITNHSSGVNQIAYADVSREDRRALQAYISDLEAVSVSGLNRDEQMAFWLNLYNAVTVELILEHYPVDSIRDINISGRPFNRHPWDAELVTVEGEAVSLNDIEHRIIRPIWQDERIHYAVNCASVGCPNLHPVPFSGENYRAVFEEAAHAYVNHPRGARFEGDRLHISSIYEWYQEDFGDDIEGVVDHLLEYAEPDLAGRLRSYAGNNYRPRARDAYDWALNEP